MGRWTKLHYENLYFTYICIIASKIELSIMILRAGQKNVMFLIASPIIKVEASSHKWDIGLIYTSNVFVTIFEEQQI